MGIRLGGLRMDSCLPSETRESLGSRLGSFGSRRDADSIDENKNVENECHVCKTIQNGTRNASDIYENGTHDAVAHGAKNKNKNKTKTLRHN